MLFGFRGWADCAEDWRVYGRCGIPQFLRTAFRSKCLAISQFLRISYRYPVILENSLQDLFAHIP